MKFFAAVAVALWLPMAVAVGQAPPEGVDALGDALPPNALMRLGSLRFRHPGTVYELALSPDERMIVSMGDKIIAWDAATGKQLWSDSLRQPVNGVAYGMRLLAFSPDGRRVYHPMYTDSLLARDAATGSMVQDDGTKVIDVSAVLTFDSPFPPPGVNAANDFGFNVRAVDASPDGLRLAVGQPRGLVVCDLAGKIQFSIPNNPVAPVVVDDTNRDRLLFGGDYCSGQFSPDGKLLALVASEAPREIRLVDATTGAEIRRIALTEKVVRLVFSLDGKRIAATERNPPPKERDAAVRLYDVETGAAVWSHVVKLDSPYENYASAIAFAPDGKSIAACATDNKIYLLDAATGDEQARLEGTNWNPWALAYTRDGATLYSSGWDGMVRRWDVAAKTQRPLPAGVRGTGTVAISRDGSRIAYEDDGGVIHVVDAGGAELRTLSLPQAAYSDLAFSPDGRQLAGGGACGDDVHVALWGVADGKLVRRWDWAKGRDPHSIAGSLQFSPDGRRLAAIVFRQDVVKSWELETGELIAENKHNEVYGDAYSPDGQTLATVGWDSTIRLWEAATGKLRLEQKVKPMGDVEQNGVVFRRDDMRMYAVAYSPWDGTLATSHMNNELRIWNAADLSLRTAIRSEASFSQGSMQYSPDGQWICAGRGDGVVQLWDAFQGKSAWVVGAHEDDHNVVDFGGGARLLTGGSDGAGYLWDLRPPAGHPVYKKSLESLMQVFFSDDTNGAYCAFWTLAAEPETAVRTIAERLRAVELLLDPEVVEGGVDEAERLRTQRLKSLLLEKDDSVLRPVAAHRAVGLLRHIGTPASRAVLEELAAKNPDGELARLAAAARK